MTSSRTEGIKINGCPLATEYGTSEALPGMTVRWRLPFTPSVEPTMYMDLPGGLDDLQVEVLEVIEGIKKHYVG